jgi:LmbE family N-acetylglucosaminyl deacetylase
MKLRIFFTPAIAVALLGAAALLFAIVVLAGSRPFDLLALPLMLFYLVLFAMSGWALLRIRAIERWASWDSPQRLLILAPHEDDCVISAGGIGARNRKLGGVTRVVYLAPDETPGMAKQRAIEAREAWRKAGVAEADLVHLDLLPPLRERDPRKLQIAASVLRSIIDGFKPTTMVVPMFEGGHVQHDIVAALVASIVTDQDRFDLFEAPEYSPYTSLRHTPHRVISLCTRWLFGLVSYYGPPDGIDDRPIIKFKLTPDELGCKRHMLGEFKSQNAPSLMETRSYPDRLVRWDGRRLRRRPFEISGSYLGLALAARRMLSASLVDRLFAVQLGTIGREGTVTDWTAESTVGPSQAPQ